MGRPRALALVLVLAGMLLVWCPFARALDPKLDVNQYAHTAWTVREGFAKGSIYSIAQTPDGYLWLGTEFGLLRFDGVRNLAWQPTGDQRLPPGAVRSLLVTRDGTLWIGADKGLAGWKNGKLTQYPELAGQYIFKLIQDRDDVVWVGSAGVPTGKLCAIQGRAVRCYGEDGSLGRAVLGLYEDRQGNLWAGVRDGLWRWSPGPPKFYPLPGNPDGVQALGEDADGTLLVGWKGGIHRFVGGKTEAYELLGVRGQFRAKGMLRDRDGGLWIGTQTQGLVHVHHGGTDVFTSAQGLSGDEVRLQGLFEDSEGNIWVATTNGLDRFRDFAVATLTANQGLSNALVGSVLADRDGSVWLGTFGGLNQWSNGQIKTYRLGGSKLNDIPESLFEDDRRRIWVSTARGIGYLESGKFIPTSGVPGGNILSISQDTAGNLWVDNESYGLFRVSPRNEIRQFPWAGLGHKDHASVVASDPVQGGLWIGFFLGGIAYFKDGQVRASYTTADGLGEGRVSSFLFGRDGALWVSTEGGLSRLKNGHVATLTRRNGLPCDTVHWVMEDDDLSFWLYTACGLISINRSELNAWVTDPRRTIHPTVFDSSDGVRSLAAGGHFGPQVAKSRDGRIWFLPWDGVSVIDPRHLPFNKLPPPVHIEQIIADRKTYDAALSGNGQMRLPPMIHELQINYTALSLVASEKMLFRYKLEGVDRDWQDAGTRRQAFYNDLSPRKYTFRVMACNNSGVWNEAGTSLNFIVAPAYYQTFWFRSLCAIVFLALVAGMYQLRVRQLAGQFNMRLEERVHERTRIARDLHDTLLQSFQGLMLKFRVLSFLLDRPAEARKMLEEVIEQGRAAITEGRDAVHGLRSSTVVTNDLAQAISALGEQLNSGQTGRQPSDFRVHVEGATREIVPLLRDDVYRIAGEALRNAFHHAGARQVEVEIRYDHRQFRLRVRDDGKGIDSSVLAGDGRPRHYGLPGMHERAKLIGGKLDVWSELDAGTEIELTIPASIAYVETPVKRRFLFWRGRADQDHKPK